MSTVERVEIGARFLTPDAKRNVLEGWKARLAEPRPSGDLAGKGWPDLGIVSLCEKLNDLPGVCTLQSCAGHGYNGNMWLWLDETTSLGFDQWGHVLSRMVAIESVSRKYARWGQEVTIIDFESDLENASQSILVFFKSLVSVFAQPG